MKDREISLTELIVKILLEWRAILVWMLVGAILMGGLSYVRSCQTQKTQLAEQERLLHADEESFLKRLTETELYNVYTVLENERLSETQELYLQESIRMHIDALNVPRVELTYWVDAEELEMAYQIEKIYADVISGGLTKWLAEKDGKISEAAMSELVEVKSGDKDIAFTIYVFHESKDQCLNIAEQVEEYINEQYARLKKELGNHEVQLISQNFTYVVDITLLNRQQGIRSDMLKWETNNAKLKDGFSEAEWQYYNYMKENNVTQQDSGSYQTEGKTQANENLIGANAVVHPTIDFKYVLLGMIIFAFLYAFIVFIKIILNDKVQMSDDIAAMYGVYELGVIPTEHKKKKFLQVVDEWILKIYNRKKRQFSSEKAAGLAAVAVKIAARKEGLQEVYCVGCNLQDDALAIADNIENILKKENISMMVISDILYNKEAMELVLSARGAFLLEKAGETLYDEIDREIQLLQRQNIKVLGMIVME